MGRKTNKGLGRSVSGSLRSGDRDLLAALLKRENPGVYERFKIFYTTTAAPWKGMADAIKAVPPNMEKIRELCQNSFAPLKTILEKPTRLAELFDCASKPDALELLCAQIKKYSNFLKTHGYQAIIDHAYLRAICQLVYYQKEHHPVEKLPLLLDQEIIKKTFELYEPDEHGTLHENPDFGKTPFTLMCQEGEHFLDFIEKYINDVDVNFQQNGNGPAALHLVLDQAHHYETRNVDENKIAAENAIKIIRLLTKHRADWHKKVTIPARKGAAERITTAHELLQELQCSCIHFKDLPTTIEGFEQQDQRKAVRREKIIAKLLKVEEEERKVAEDEAVKVQAINRQRAEDKFAALQRLRLEKAKADCGREDVDEDEPPATQHLSQKDLVAPGKGAFVLVGSDRGNSEYYSKFQERLVKLISSLTSSQMHGASQSGEMPINFNDVKLNLIVQNMLSRKLLFIDPILEDPKSFKRCLTPAELNRFDGEAWVWLNTYDMLKKALHNMSGKAGFDSSLLNELEKQYADAFGEAHKGRYFQYKENFLSNPNNRARSRRTMTEASPEMIALKNDNKVLKELIVSIKPSLKDSQVGRSAVPSSGRGSPIYVGSRADSFVADQPIWGVVPAVTLPEDSCKQIKDWLDADWTGKDSEKKEEFEALRANLPSHEIFSSDEFSDLKTFEQCVAFFWVPMYLTSRYNKIGSVDISSNAKSIESLCDDGQLTEYGVSPSIHSMFNDQLRQHIKEQIKLCSGLIDSANETAASRDGSIHEYDLHSSVS